MELEKTKSIMEPAKNKIFLCDQEIEYQLRQSRRARRMRMAIYRGGEFVVTIPWGFSVSLMEKFIREKSGWVVGKIEYFKKFKNKIFLGSSRREYLKNKNKALELARGRVAHFSSIYNLKYNQISIRNQKTRWGSCSKKGNLNFNYKIIYLPERLADYIFVHEICHLQEFNHSKNFWSLVRIAVPDYRSVIQELRKL